jgi:hypothetical protein
MVDGLVTEGFNIDGFKIERLKIQRLRIDGFKIEEPVIDETTIGETMIARATIERAIIEEIIDGIQIEELHIRHKLEGRQRACDHEVGIIQHDDLPVQPIGCCSPLNSWDTHATNPRPTTAAWYPQLA